MPSSEVYLLVEGKNDRHVVWALCKRHELPDVFSVETPGIDEGIEALLQGLPLRLQGENLRILGIMVDADQDVRSRWQSLHDRLHSSGYVNFPDRPLADGWVSDLPNLPRVGVWLMPDNQQQGILEDFVTSLYRLMINYCLEPKVYWTRLKMHTSIVIQWRIIQKH
jgi:hypothetical protein